LGRLLAFTSYGGWRIVPGEMLRWEKENQSDGVTASHNDAPGRCGQFSGRRKGPVGGRPSLSYA
jgi:hypothetical protein